MEPIRIVWGTGTGPTPLAAYDGALAAANVHEYNLVVLSSVIPPEATIELVGTAPSLGTVGDQLTVVEASTTAKTGPISAAIGWARRGDGSGIFYEASGTSGPESVRNAVLEGIRSGMDRRSGAFDDPTVEIASTVAEESSPEYASVAVLAVYGTGDSVL